MGRPLIALLGKSGAGKNVAASLLSQRGWKVVDVDQVGHQVLAEHAGAVRRLFPELSASVPLNRQELGRLVFADVAKLEQLEQLVHPLLKKKVNQTIHRYPGPVVMQGAVLEKIGLLDNCNLIVWLDAPFLLRCWRVWRRDRHLRWRDIWARMKLQQHLAPLKKSSGKWVKITNGLCRSKKTLARVLDRVVLID